VYGRRGTLYNREKDEENGSPEKGNICTNLCALESGLQITSRAVGAPKAVAPAEPISGPLFLPLVYSFTIKAEAESSEETCLKSTRLRGVKFQNAVFLIVTVLRS
jgi:hypothetical protein